MGILDDVYNEATEEVCIIDEETEGTEKKYWTTFKGEKYLLKDSSFNLKRKQKSYSPYCEFLASHFINGIGYNAHITSLQLYENRPVVLCKDLFSTSVFEPFKGIHESSAGTDLGNKEYTYEDVLHVLESITNGDNESLLIGFWDMFLLDAIIGNRDRHEGNWGFRRRDGLVEFCTLFDQGSSLFPDVDLSNWKDTLFIKERVFKIPASQFKRWRTDVTDRPMRTNFYEVIQDCLASKTDVFLDRFNLLAGKKNLVYQTIDNLYDKLIPKDFLRFVKIILYCRYSCLILQRDFEDVVKEAYLRY